MEQSEFQRRVTDAIMERETSEVTIRLSDSENLVIVELEESDAAFTATEARQFVAAIEQTAMRNGWEETVEDLFEYTRDLASVVENKTTAEAVAEKWNKDIQQ